MIRSSNKKLYRLKQTQGYAKDKELANWVRNQRLEQANMKKGNKSRMTLERYEKLDGLGFKWSTSIEKKGGSAKKAGKEDDSSKDDGAAATKKKTDEATADDVNAEVEATIAAASEAAAEATEGVEV